MVDQVESESRIVYLWTAAHILALSATAQFIPVLILPVGLVAWTWMFGFGFYMWRRHGNR